MKNIDLIFLIALAIVASCLMFIPNRIKGIVEYLIVFTGILAVLQFLLEGYYWHYLPGYLLISFMAMVSIFLKERISKLKGKLMNMMLVLLVVVSIAPG